MASQIKHARNPVLQVKTNAGFPMISNLASETKERGEVEFPWDLQRLSLFFPMSRSQVAKRPYLKRRSIESPWGQMEITGPQLSTWDEDVLLAFMKAMQDHPENCVLKEDNGRIFPGYDGPLLNILKILGVQKGGSAVKSLKESLILLMGTVAEIKPKGGGDGFILTNIVDGPVDCTGSSKGIRVFFCPYFSEMSVLGRVMTIDMNERRGLSPLAKGVHRFICSHRGREWGPGNYLFVARAINMNLSKPPRKTKYEMKMAIDEMIKREVLIKESGFVNDSNMVILRRSGLHYIRNFIEGREAEPDPEPEEKATYSSEFHTFVSWIMAEIKKIDSGYPDSQEGVWNKHLSALLEGRTREEIKETFRWALGHFYWTTHVVAPYSFRKHYTSIRGAFLKDSARSGSSGEVSPLVYYKAIKEILAKANVANGRYGEVFEIDLCPFCQDRERRFRMNGKTGKFRCSSCGEAGDFDKFSKAMQGFIMNCQKPACT